ncbi:MAG TPA: hypothetical protein VHJ20_14525 [Polyangia bacterium]|nr:hypothetical protein [Polyangia bacterium]
MNKTTILFGALTMLSVGCASFGGAPGGRGAVHADGPAIREVVAGPLSIHVYSEDAGGAIYAAPAVTGTDRDCAAPEARRDAASLPGDHVTTFTVAAGQVACLATSTTRPFELLWHALDDAPAPDARPVFVASRRGSR